MGLNQTQLAALIASMFSGSGLIGGVAVGAAGATGSIYDGFVLSGGDDFDTLDILAPHKPRGKWRTTRAYAPNGARGGASGPLAVMYDVDPYHTGYNDANRGVPVGYNNLSASGGVLTLQARRGTAQEIAKTDQLSGRSELGSMISSQGALSWFAGAAGSADVIVEALMSFSAAASNPAGWHPTFWMTSIGPSQIVNGDEYDWEGTSQAAYFDKNQWSAGSVTPSQAGSPRTHDGQMALITYIVNGTNVRLFVNGALYATFAGTGNSAGLPQYLLFTSHVYNASFFGETYNASAWADADGAKMLVDYVRVWRRAGAAHYKPLAALADQNVDYGGSITITLPSAAVLWGDGTVSEDFRAVYAENNEPGVTDSSVYSQFPLGVAYNSSTRQLTVNITSGKTGRINFVMHAYKAGSTCEPLRFAVNVGPVVNVNSIQLTAGQVLSYDLYTACDCGVLVTDGTSRAKTISVSNLAGSGLSYNDATGLLTGTFVAGTYAVSVTVTNSLGQSKTASVTVSTASGYAYAGWTSDGIGWFDFSDTSSRTMVGSSVTAISNKRGSSFGDFVGAGAARTITIGGQNSLDYVSFARDVSGNPARFVAVQTTALAQAFQGANKPYTVLVVYRPTDANTGYIWSASDTVDSIDSQTIALIRRSASASSARRGLVTTTGNDINFGAGQASGAWRIVAVKDTGSAVTIWDTSTTKSVDSSARTVGTFNNELAFYLGASETNTTDPTYAPVACAADYAEILVQSAARSDAEIQQAITDMAAKWGITLS
jgi:hypothetical protein